MIEALTKIYRDFYEHHDKGVLSVSYDESIYISTLQSEIVREIMIINQLAVLYLDITNIDDILNVNSSVISARNELFEKKFL